MPDTPHARAHKLARTHTRACAHTHTHTNAHTNAHTHTHNQTRYVGDATVARKSAEAFVAPTHDTIGGYSAR